MRLLELQHPFPPSLAKSRTKYTEGKLAQIIRLLRSPGPWSDPDTTYIRLLQSCASFKALAEGKQVHSHLLVHGVYPNSHTWFGLISMYANCGCFPEACYLLRSMPHRTCDAWTALIAAYTHHGHYEEVLELFCEMLQENLSANDSIVVFALNACMHLVAAADGLRLHDYIVKRKLESSLMVQNSLIKMYSACHGLQHAEKVFVSMGEKNVESWTAILAAYADHGLFHEALRLFRQMLEAGLQPNNIIFISMLKECANLGELEIGRDIHQYIKANGLGSETVLNNLLISMYARCGSINEARCVFDLMPRKDVVSWNEMIGGYTRHGLDKEAFTIFERLKREAIKPDVMTVSRVIIACINLQDLGRSREIHRYIMKNGFKYNTEALNNVLDMYTKCATIKVAREVFDGLPTRDMDTFNIMIRAYLQLDQYSEALRLFQLMQTCKIEPSKATFADLLIACASHGALEQGKEIFYQLIRSKYEAKHVVSSALIEMYSMLV